MDTKRQGIIRAALSFRILWCMERGVHPTLHTRSPASDLPQYAKCIKRLPWWAMANMNRYRRNPTPNSAHPTRNDSEEFSDFPPIRIHKSTPPAPSASPSRPHSQAAFRGEPHEPPVRCVIFQHPTHQIQFDQLETTPKNFQISHPIHILKRLLEDQNVGHLRKNRNHVGCRWRKGLDKGM